MNWCRFATIASLTKSHKLFSKLSHGSSLLAVTAFHVIISQSTFKTQLPQHHAFEKHVQLLLHESAIAFSKKLSKNLYLAMVLHRDSTTPQGDVWQCLQIFLVLMPGEGGAQQGQNRDADAQPPAKHRE